MSFRLWLALCALPLAAASSYRAAAVEFAPTQSPGNASADEVVSAKLKNLAELANFARQAKANGTQIIVFPEYGITGDGTSDADFTRKSVQPFLEQLPDDFNDACHDSASQTISPAIVKVSCLAQELKMVIVFNLATKEPCVPGDRDCPADGMFVHNTAIAMNESGSILSVYHKRHLYGDEVHYMNPSDNPKARFTTSFGVKFGMFICFDIVWETSDPDISNVVYPTDWVNNAFGPVTPYARTAQQAWSELHSMNLIAANYGGFGKHASGSGIYAKGTTLTSFFNPTEKPESKLLMADIPQSGLRETTARRVIETVVV